MTEKIFENRLRNYWCWRNKLCNIKRKADTYLKSKAWKSALPEIYGQYF